MEMVQTLSKLDQNCHLYCQITHGNNPLFLFYFVTAYITLQNQEIKGKVASVIQGCIFIEFRHLKDETLPSTSEKTDSC